MGGEEGIAGDVRSHRAVTQDEMGQHGKNCLASRALHAPDGEATEPNAGIMGVASQTTTAVTGRFMGQLEADGEDEGKDALDEGLRVVKELRVGGLIVEIDGDRTVLAWCFGGLCQVSSPWEWR